MGGSEQKSYSSLNDTCRRYRGFNNVVQTLGRLHRMINPRLFQFDTPLRKKDETFTEYQKPNQKLVRPLDNDRIFPLDTIVKEEFSTRTDTKLENVNIHTGQYADEFARSFNALAVTLATDIYFRNGAYNPTSEEGRKTITHELTHVGQHTEKRITKNITEKELEEEAEQFEQFEAYNPNPYITINLNGKNFTLLKSNMSRFANIIAGKVDEWIMEQKFILNEREYLNLLCSYKEWLMEVV